MNKHWAIGYLTGAFAAAVWAADPGALGLMIVLAVVIVSMAKWGIQ